LKHLERVKFTLQNDCEWDSNSRLHLLESQPGIEVAVILKS